MEKDQNTDSESQNNETEEIKAKELNKDAEPDASDNNKDIKEPTPEEKINELEDKVVRTLAEMENQRRRFEKEKEDAFDYGGFSFAKKH